MGRLPGEENASKTGMRPARQSGEVPGEGTYTLRSRGGGPEDAPDGESERNQSSLRPQALNPVQKTIQNRNLPATMVFQRIWRLWFWTMRLSDQARQ